MDVWKYFRTSMYYSQHNLGYLIARPNVPATSYPRSLLSAPHSLESAE